MRGSWPRDREYVLLKMGRRRRRRGIKNKERDKENKEERDKEEGK